MSFRFARADDVEGRLAVSVAGADLELDDTNSEFSTDDRGVADVLRNLSQLKELGESSDAPVQSAPIDVQSPEVSQSQ